MKKLLTIILTIVVIALAVWGGFLLLGREEASEVDKIEQFSLSEEMYGQGEFREITAEELEQLIETKKSFVVVVHMVVCPAEFPVTSIAKQLAHDDGVVIYGLMEEEFKQTALAKTIRYLPSVALYREGELVAYLDAESDSDLEYYKTVDGLRRWLSRYLTNSL